MKYSVLKKSRGLLGGRSLRLQAGRKSEHQKSDQLHAGISQYETPFVIIVVVVIVCACTHSCTHSYKEVRRQLMEVGFLLPHVSQGSQVVKFGVDAFHQTLPQTPV